MFRKPGVPVFFLLLLLLAGFFALTQESDSGADAPGIAVDAVDSLSGGELEDESAEESPPEWVPLAPPRWFRSNAGGMALEEIPSRFAALRNEYALVVDYISPAELPKTLKRFYQETFDIEIRVLYAAGEESRRQWLFRNEAGETRMVAVFDRNPDDVPPPAAAAAPSDGVADSDTAVDENADVSLAEAVPESESVSENVIGENAADDSPPPEKKYPAGFIEVYNENFQITGEYQYYEDGGETVTDFFYNRNVLVKAEAQQKTSGGDYKKIFTDNYRYNRSASLRSVERVYHEMVENEPVRLAFPNRILDAAADNNFIKEKIPLGSDFLGDSYAGQGYRMVYTTDERGRVLSQSLLDEEDTEVWILKNTWAGDRIIAALRIEGDEERLTEYEYDSTGNRILERNLRNGVLERLVRSDGYNETEELYMNGEKVLVAVWENGRKISEERVRKRPASGRGQNN